MIYGIGVDIISMKRIESGYTRFTERFASHILSKSEREEFEKSPNKVNFLAKRFVAKEAFSKAVHTGLLHPVTLSNISVKHESSGQPYFEFDLTLQRWLDNLDLKTFHLSLSDDSENVTAFVVIEK